MRGITPKLAATALAAVATISVVIPARAQPPQTITLSTWVKPDYIAGDLIGCQLAFEVARNDTEYSNGNLVYLTGSLWFTAFEGKDLSFSLKLGVKKLGPNDDFTQPSVAYLIDGYKSNAADFLDSFEGAAGFRIFLYSAEAGNITSNVAVRQILQNQHFTFAYAMEPGGLNAIVPVDLQVQEFDLDAPERSLVSDKTSRDWGACFNATLKAARNRLEAAKAVKDATDAAAAAVDMAVASAGIKR